ncbi:MAG TPA: branched-chain amino acid ABC transporter permease [Arthrobacter sp.]|nr:branched-chain amino acid ABC transporter permease [Arthrobacter sp.]
MTTLVTAFPVVLVACLMAWSLWFPIAAGQLSMAVPAFVGAGAYAAGLLALHVTDNIVVGLALGGAVGAVYGIPFGLVCARLSVFGLAVATLGVVQIQETIVQNASSLGGSVGLIGIPTQSTILPGCLVCVVVIAFSIFVFHGRQGRILDVVRHNEGLAKSIGISPFAVKMYVLMVSGLVAGLAGVLHARYTGFIDPTQFGSALIVQLFAFVMLGGQNSYWGPIAGAATLTFGLQYLAAIGDYRNIAFGAVLVLIIVVRRDGVISRSLALRARRLRRQLRRTRPRQVAPGNNLAGAPPTANAP